MTKSTADGARFVAALQRENNPKCYKHFFESEKLGVTQKRAQEKAAETGRQCLIIDRKEHMVIEYVGENVVPKVPPTPVEIKEIGKVAKTKGPPRKRRSKK